MLCGVGSVIVQFFFVCYVLIVSVVVGCLIVVSSVVVTFAVFAARVDS